VLEDLRRRDVAVEVTAVDVGDPEAVARLLDGFGRVRPVLRGVVHAAGVLRDSLLVGQDRAALAEIFAAKARGAETLDRLTTGRGLDFLLFMSSMAGLFGALGQAGYGAANAFVDGLARRRRACGEAAVSIAWGPWREAGMAARLGVAGAAARHARGIGALTTDEARASLDRALHGRAPVVAALRMDWPRFLASLPAGAGPLAASALPPAAMQPVVSGPAVPQVADTLAQLAALPPLARRGRLRLLVGDTLAAVMGGARPDPNRGFFDQGMDSLMAVEFRARLNAMLGDAVSATVVFEHATVVALSDHLLSVLPFGPPQPEAVVAPATQQSDTLSSLLAMLGAAGHPAADSKES
jgi:hypothetical protein